MDQTPRRHGYRGRRGPDRRGPDRRGPAPSQPQQQRNDQVRNDQVDVEQIMRDIRTRIVQQHGVNLPTDQIQELATRRLESILDLRTVSPSLVEQLRRSAGAKRTEAIQPKPVTPPFEFEDVTIYDSHRGLMRLIRKLLYPILKLFFNPNP